MNIRGMANAATSAINANIAAALEVYTGLTTAASGRRTPTYAAPVAITVQMQALTKKEIEHLDALNISNAESTVYANRQLSGIDRTTQSGGDILTIAGEKWLVVAVLEGWVGSGWCKAAISRQMGA